MNSRCLLHSLLSVFPSLLTLGCVDARKAALGELLSFTQATPYTLGAPDSFAISYTIIVVDSSLPQYNRLFAHFDPADSTRLTAYRNIPRELLFTLPITKIERQSFRELTGDTLLATVVFQRPARDLFIHYILDPLRARDSLPPSPETILAFGTALRRARQELQEQDTAFVWLSAGSEIARLRTASGIRDSILLDSLATNARVHLSEFVQYATLRRTEFADYSNQGTTDGVLVAGSVKGMIDPGEKGWFYTQRPYMSIEVVCEGKRGDQATVERAYLGLGANEGNHPKEFLCLWAGRSAEVWSRVKPTTVRARIVAQIQSDSMMGPWVLVH